MYVQFYNSNSGNQESAYEVKQATGLDPETTGPVALETVGIYPIAKVNQPYNTELYDVEVSWDTSTGYAVRSWTPTARTLSDVIEDAKSLRMNTIVGRIQTLRRVSGYDSGLLRAADGIDDLVRPARFDYWVDRINSALSTLDTELTSIEGAATVDAINDIVSPAHGVINIALDESNPLNLLASDFKYFFSKNYTESDLELYFPSTSTTVAYSSGFAATSSVVTATDSTVQVRVASTGVIVDEFELYPATTSSLSGQSFGFKKYEGYRESSEERDFSYTYTNEDPIQFTVTVSGGVFEIDSYASEGELVQGRVYRFDQSDASNSGHPLRIYTDADKTTEVVSRVAVVGTPGTAGAYTEYIPGSAGNFSYQCANHAAMGKDFTVVDVYGRSVEAIASGSGGRIGFSNEGY